MKGEDRSGEKGRKAGGGGLGLGLRLCGVPSERWFVLGEGSQGLHPGLVCDAPSGHLIGNVVWVCDRERGWGMRLGMWLGYAIGNVGGVCDEESGGWPGNGDMVRLRDRKRRRPMYPRREVDLPA